MSTVPDSTDPFASIDLYRPVRTEVPSAWFGHVPFGHWLAAELRPALLVELGTHNGVSFASFCDAVLDAELSTTCFAVDTWQGDPQAGEYGEEVWTDWNAFAHHRYGDFLHLLRMTFDEAVERFADGSIDLLHIDGLHTYEAVRNDVDRWLPKVSARGVVLMHDIAERDRDFGVWRVWDELKAAYPSFEFHHEHGLGVLAVGAEVPEAVRPFVEADDREAARLRARFAGAGDRLVLDEERLGLHRRLAQSYGDREAETAQAAARIASLEAELGTVRPEHDRLRADNSGLRRQAAELRASTSWRVTAPLRSVSSAVRAITTRRR
jgi:O-antigen biosynthesis protein